MIALTFFNSEVRIYSPIQKCLRKMNASERRDYSVQLSDYIFNLARSGADSVVNSRKMNSVLDPWWGETYE